MKTTYRLRRIDRSLRRADPHLAAMLAIFARLYAAEAILSQEQPGPGRIRRALAWLAGALITLAAWTLRAARAARATWTLRAAGAARAARAAVRGRFRGGGFRGGPVRAGRRR